MVLVCNDPRFIFLKTMKTAGTSVEKLFQRHCLPEGHDGVVIGDPVISERGIVGARGVTGRQVAERAASGDPVDWWNHMPASAVADRLGTDFFASAFKFATVRNPYRIVLSFYFFTRKVPYPTTPLAFRYRRLRFRRWLMRQRNLEGLGNHGIVHLDGAFALDDYIRQEHLREDIERIARKLGLAVNTDDLSHDKPNRSGAGLHPPGAYFNDSCAAVVQKAFGWCFDHCGYSRDVSKA